VLRAIATLCAAFAVGAGAVVLPRRCESRSGPRRCWQDSCLYSRQGAQETPPGAREVTVQICKIVVGCDFSPEAERAVQQGVEIARHVGAEVVLVHAGALHDTVQDVPQAVSRSVREYEVMLKEHLDEVRAQLEALRQRVSGQGVEVSHMVIDGFADTGLCEAARELGADLVVTGTHGRTGVSRFLLGSVAERVVRLCSMPVLVARGEAPRGGYRRILVPTDFSDAAEAALDMALQVAGRDAHIELLHCWNLPPGAGGYLAELSGTRGVYETVRDAVTEGADAAAERLLGARRGRGSTVAFTRIQAPAARGIQQFMDERGPWDLVIVGSHGRRGLSRFLLGSVAEVTVRHAPCSTLVVHVPRSETAEAA
jgi:nucleotide-binding universal stress UspA family protein